MSGWIKLHRKISDNPLWHQEPFTRGQAWVDLILLANHTAGFIRARGVRVDLERGQCGWSEVKLAKRWQWSRGKVKRFINELEIDQQIVQQKNNVTSLITIVNYNDYQSDGTANDTPKRTASDTANGQQTGSKQDTNKNEKELKRTKKNEKKSNHDTIVSSVVFPNDFDEELKESFLDWCEMRQEKGEYVTALVVKRHFKSLDGFMKCDIMSAYNLAIQKGWTAVFPKKLSEAEGGINIESRKALERM